MSYSIKLFHYSVETDLRAPLAGFILGDTLPLLLCFSLLGDTLFVLPPFQLVVEGDRRDLDGIVRGDVEDLGLGSGGGLCRTEVCRTGLWCLGLFLTGLGGLGLCLTGLGGLGLYLTGLGCLGLCLPGLGLLTGFGLLGLLVTGIGLFFEDSGTLVGAGESFVWSEPADPLSRSPRRRWRLELRLIGILLVDRRDVAMVENSDSSSEVKSSS